MNNLQGESNFFNDDESDFNLKELIQKYLSYWKWFLLSIIIAISSAFVYLQFQTPVYKVQSSLLIKDERKGLGQDDMLSELNIFSSNKVVDNEIEILKSYTLMERVVKNLNLDVTYYVPEKFTEREIYEESPIRFEVLKPTSLAFQEKIEVAIDGKTAIVNGQKVPFNTVTKTPLGYVNISPNAGVSSKINLLKISVAQKKKVAESFVKNLLIEPSSKTSSVLLMSLEVTNHKKGEDIINTLISEYNEAGLEDKNKVAANTLRFIEDRLKLISGDLTKVEEDVQNFRSREGITDISAESQLFLQNVQQNDNQLNQVRIQESVLNSIEQYVRKTKPGQGTVPATLGISDPTLLGLITALSEVETKRTEVIKLVKADNPMVVALDEQIESLRNNIVDNIQTLKNSLVLTRQQLERQNQKIEGIIKTVPVKERALVDITRQQSIKNNLYIFLLQKREETALSYASAVSDSRTIDFARGIDEPVAPSKRKIYLIFLALGLLVPIGIIYLLDVLNDKVQNRKEIEKLTTTPIISEISFSTDSDGLVVDSSSRSAIAEQVRALRTNLSFIPISGRTLKKILFTSSISGEGKSFVSLNLGASLALTNKRTIILEFDLRKPKLHSALGIENGKGLSNYLIGMAEIEEIIKPVPGINNYFIITSGAIPPNPVELLLSERLPILYKELEDKFDYIVTDAPPIGVVTDAQVLEKESDASLFVIRHDFTPKDRLKMLDDFYRQKKFKNLNIIFNGIKEGGRYGYGYGYGYYQEEGKNKA